ncbi:MAG: SEC-C metal-binding domain-containing protein [Gammaproteobacteria bacterium]
MHDPNHVPAPHIHGPGCNHDHDHDHDHVHPPAQDPIRNPLRDVGRNDPCPCGSGQKFKKCHGKA